MRNFNKVYKLNAEGIEFTVKQYAPQVPLLFLRLPGIDYGGHYFHHNGFEYYLTSGGNISDELKGEIYDAFDKCQKYLDTNPIDGDPNIPYSKEYF